MAFRVSAPLVCLAAFLAAGGSVLATDGRGGGSRPGEGGRPGDGPRWRDPGIIIEPNIDLSRPRQPDRNSPDVMMANIEACSANGVPTFVDCLRGSASPVAIRRLEACLRSESIPEDLGEVAACLPGLSPRWK